MDSRAYASLTPGMETAEELDACTLLVNSQVCVQTVALILRNLPVMFYYAPPSCQQPGMCKECSDLAHTIYL